jgi:uncharacterized protein YbcI
MINSKKKLEAEISEALIKFQRELIGKGPQEAKTYIVNDMLIARYKGVLTVEEKHLVSGEINNYYRIHLPLIKNQN